MTDEDATIAGMDPSEHRPIAVAMFNHVWSLMETADRTIEQDDRMLHMAHASRLHWELSEGAPENLARGEWQVSRVHAMLGRGEPAIHHARRCLQICQANGIGDFDLAYAYEALARAHGVAGDEHEARRYASLAREAAAGIVESDEREQFEQDLAMLPVS
jgi:hypothetical protein